MADYTLTLFEACEVLNKSKKSVSRYIRQGRLHPKEIKSQQGTLEYRFSRADLDKFRGDRGDKTGQTGQNETEGTKRIKSELKRKPEQTGQRRQDTPLPEPGKDFYVLFKETTDILKDQLKAKDEQIKALSGQVDQLIERSRETNIILKGLQDKLVMLEAPKADNGIEITQTEETGQTRQDRGDKTRQDKRRGLVAILKKKGKGKVMPAPAKGKKPERKRGLFKRLFNL